MDSDTCYLYMIQKEILKLNGLPPVSNILADCHGIRTVSHGHFPDRLFPSRLFRQGQFLEDISPTDSSANGQFLERTFPRRTVHQMTFPRTDISPNGHFPESYISFQE